MASPGRGHQPPPWWAGPLQGVGSALTNLQRGLQQLGDAAQRPSGPGGAALPHRRLLPQAAASAPPLGVGGTLAPHAAGINADFEAGGVPTAATRSTRAAPHPVTKEELGRATWTFLHTLAAQYPEHPTRQQKRDAMALVDALTRIYPCAECAEHFAELVRHDPPTVGSRAEFAGWMCRAHNCVNRRLGKPSFNCDLLDARWAPLDCGEANACDLTVGRRR